jgi:hypothetical protein
MGGGVRKIHEPIEIFRYLARLLSAIVRAIGRYLDLYPVRGERIWDISIKT